MYNKLKQMIIEKKRDEVKKIFLKLSNEDVNFKRNLFVNGIIKNPVSVEYKEEDFELIIPILKECSLDTKNCVFLELLIMLEALYRNVKNNSSKLEEIEYFKEETYTKIFKLFAYLEYNFLETNKILKKESGNIISGASGEVCNVEVEYTNEKTSITNNYEGHVEATEEILRYILYKEKEEIGKTIHKNIELDKNLNIFNDPEFEKAIFLGVQRASYKNIWEKIKYLEWNTSVDKKNKCIVFRPTDFKKNQLNQMALQREKNIEGKDLVTALSEMDQIKSIRSKALKNWENLNCFSNEWILNIPDNVLLGFYEYTKLINKEILKEFGEYILNKKIGEFTIKKIIEVHMFLFAISQIKQNFIEECSGKQNVRLSDLIDIITIDDLVNLYARITDTSPKKSKKILKHFIFEKKLEEDIFIKPLIKIGKDTLLISHNLILSRNYRRIVYKLIKANGVDIASGGKEFEQNLRKELRKYSNIKMNSEEREIKYSNAFDGRDIEFDFLGKFENDIFLMEFKNLSPSGEPKDIFDNERIIKEAVKQVNRREEALKKDSKKIQEFVEFDIENYSNIRKIVVTNIFNFTGLIYDEVLIVDESTLLKFFKNPYTEYTELNYRKATFTKSFQPFDAFSIQDFLSYLSSPVTTNIFNNCFEIDTYKLHTFSGDYQFAIEENRLVKDPYKKEIMKRGLKKLGRNEICLCGSQKKYKKCCGK